MNNEERITQLEEHMTFWQEAHNELIVRYNADLDKMRLMHEDILALRLKMLPIESDYKERLTDDEEQL